MNPPKPLHHLMETLLAVQGEMGVAAGRGPAPVEAWNPPLCADIGMKITADGCWWHDGSRITRQPLIDLFARVLRKDADGQTYLVTPVEKVVVEVEDSAFVGVRVDQAQTDLGTACVLTTNLGEYVVLGAGHELRVVHDPITQAPRPYVRVRGRLEARILRAPFYEMVEWSEARDGRLWLMSQGVAFDLGSLEDCAP
jgi:hypothetical protein